ncbi:MAG: class I SAM-dependent methyltransferase [Bacteroidales bacterium]|nr:class I SAM-dependent methyltransferase [Bacteroidales bacterium]
MLDSSAYIELLKKTLIDHVRIGSYEYHPLDIVDPNWKTFILFWIHKLLKRRNFGICKIKYVNPTDRFYGYDWPANAMTMIGMNRLNNLETCVRKVIFDEIEGDFIETGVWRGGATILMRALLKELNVEDRKIWLADSFEGLPVPNTKEYPDDYRSDLYKRKILKASIEEVKNNFEHFDLLDEQVVLVKGWFKDSLPKIEIEKIAVLRLDGDLFESTHLALKYLYPKLTSGGYIIVDDYNAFPYCKKAVDSFREENKVEEQIFKIDNEAIYWRKR